MKTVRYCAALHMRARMQRGPKRQGGGRGLLEGPHSIRSCNMLCFALEVARGSELHVVVQPAAHLAHLGVPEIDLGVTLGSLLLPVSLRLR